MHRDQLQARWIQAQNWIPSQTLQKAYQDCVLESGVDLCAILLARGALTPQQAQVIRTAAARSQQQNNSPQAQAWGASPSGRAAMVAAPSSAVLSSATAIEQTAPASIAEAPSVLQARQRFGDYEILGELARGAMGIIYRARRSTDEGDVALKVMLEASPDETDQTRFHREIGVLQRLRHPHIVRVLDQGWVQEHLYFTMELLEGSDLRAVIERGGPEGGSPGGGPPPWAAMSSRLTGVARALSYCHEIGVVHRDVKPQNIIWEADRAVLIDFGLLKKDRSKLGSSQLTMGVSLTSAGQILGTPAYMAPEQFSPEGDFGGIGPPCDVWGFGATLFHAVTGAIPFPYSTAIEIFQAIIERGPRPPSEINPAVPDWLDELLLSCLARRAADRPAMPEVEARLSEQLARAASRHESTKALRSITPRSPRSSGRSRSRRVGSRDGSGVKRPASGVKRPASGALGGKASLGSGRSPRASARLSGVKGKPRSGEQRRRPRSTRRGFSAAWPLLILGFLALATGGVLALRAGVAGRPQLSALRLSSTWTRKPEVEVSGRFRGEGRLLIAGRACTPTADGGFRDTVALREGRNSIEIQVYQGVKLVATRELEAFHDARAPEIRLTNADPPGTSQVKGEEVLGLVKDASPVELELDGAAVKLEASGRFALAVEPGVHSLRARDRAGNTRELRFRAEPARTPARAPDEAPKPEASKPQEDAEPEAPPEPAAPLDPKPEEPKAAKPKAATPTPRAILEDWSLWQAASEALQDEAIGLAEKALGADYLKLRTRVFGVGDVRARLGSFRHKKTRLIFRLIPGGAFTLGQDLGPELEAELAGYEAKLAEALRERQELEDERSGGVAADDAVERLIPVADAVAGLGEAEARRRVEDHFARHPGDAAEIRDQLRRVAFGRFPVPSTDAELIEELVQRRRELPRWIRGMRRRGRRRRDRAGPVTPERAAEIAKALEELDGRIARLESIVSVRTRTPAVALRLAPFLIAEAEVSTAAWNRVAKGPERAKGVSSSFTVPLGGRSWLEIKSWLRQAGGGLRLPSEAEWEYAARAGSAGRYFWGAEIDADFASSAETGEAKPRSWNSKDFQKRGNLFGLLYCSGNLAEWCEDDWSDSYQGRSSGAPYIKSELAGRDLLKKALRGGHFASAARDVESRARRPAAPDAKDPRFGFRVARDLDLGER